MADNFLERQREEYEKRRQAKAKKKTVEWKKKLTAYAASQKEKKVSAD